MTDYAFEVDKLNCSLDGSHILHDISFSVKSGERVAIIGRNGAGKTTLLRCLGRVGVRPSGHICVYGQSLDSYTQKQLARKVSYVPQAGDRATPFSVREFLMMARYPHLEPLASPGRRDEDAVHNALIWTHMDAFSDRTMETLSGGERQKVYIAAALAQQSSTLLLDEPTTFLDYGHQVEVLELVERLHREQGLTVLTVTHDLNQGPLHCDKVLALKKGSLAYWGEPDDLLSQGILDAIYGTPFDVFPHPRTGAPLVFPSGGQIQT